MSDSLIGFSFVEVKASPSMRFGRPRARPAGRPAPWLSRVPVRLADYFAPLAERGFRVVAPAQGRDNLSSNPEGADA